MFKRPFKLYLVDILDAIEKIEEYTKNLSYEWFANDAKTIDAAVRNIEIIGEAARHLPEEFRLQYPAVPWKQIVGARDKVIHEYFGIDIEIIWKTIQEDLPMLKKRIEEIQKSQP